MINWCLGVIAECAYYIARYHDWRARHIQHRATGDIIRARRQLDKADRWSRVQQWADGVDGPYDTVLS